MLSKFVILFTISYLYCDQFSLLLFALFMVGAGVQREIGPSSLYPLLFFFMACLSQAMELSEINADMVMDL